MSTESFQDLFKDPKEQQAYISQGLQSRQDAQGIESGRLLNLLPGESVTSPTPGRPNPNFGPFVNDFYTQLGMGTNVPREVIVGVFESSYTAARAQLQQFWQTIYIERMSDEAQICNPIYHAWLFDSIADGIIEAPGFFANAFIRYAWSGAQWTGMGPSSLNPLDEARAAILLAGNLTTEQEEAVKLDGGDYKTRHRQRVREAANRREGGLPPLGATATPAKDPADDNNEDDRQTQDQQRPTP
jgi:capsid protein